ncbi:ATP-binding cassette domain-containing protein [Klebsiella oxytoca]|uniref:ATP-binding cassette domain-containing protein n=1 Tax=Klebsiella oxytoca TaxID=571 RepID=UPI0039826029
MMKRELARALAPALLLMALAATLEGVCAFLLAAAVANWQQNPGHWLGLLALATPLFLAVQYAAVTRGFFAGGEVMTALLRALFRRLPCALSPQEQAPGLLAGAIGQTMLAPAHLLAPLVDAVVTPLALIAGLACLSPGVALTLLAACALLVLVLHGSAARLHRGERELEEANQSIEEALMQFARHQALLRGGCGQAAAAEVLIQRLADHHRAHDALLRQSLPYHLSFRAGLLLTLLAALWFGSHEVLVQRLNVAQWLALMIVLARLLEPLLQLSHLEQALRQLKNACAQLRQTLAAPALPLSERDGAVPQDDGIELEAMSLAATHGGWRLREISGACAAGEMLAIVGPSGAGKSSLLNLMARTEDPTVGRVFYGGRDVRALSARQLAGGRGVMWQDNRLLRGSVRWNLTQGRTDIGDECLLALLAALSLPPDVLEEEVGSEGDRFSGGQKQRLCLARTLLQGAPRLLLDEPGASLDRRNAERVAALLAGWPGTRVVVTHDPALACRANRVWVLECGRLTETGSPDALRDAGGWFAHFCQTKMTGDR